jgi:hypothetical protein
VVSGDVALDVRRNLLNFLEATVRIASHSPGENFEGTSSTLSHGGGVFGEV